MKKIFSLLLLSYAYGLSAQDNAAMLSDQCSYLGRKIYLGPGIYRANQLGIGDNSLSSFHLPGGMALQVFEYDNYIGRTQTFYSSVACLPALWNNKVSSIKVFWTSDPGNEQGNSGNDLPPSGNRVIFYRDIKYSGMSKAAGAGNFGSAALGFLSGNISSIYIPNGYSVRVADKAGRQQVFTGSIASLAQYGWDNKINSGFIEGNYNGGGGGGNGGNLPPRGDRVIFYRDMKYTGMAKDMPPGSFSPGSLGFLLDNISSVYIPPGQSIKVYDKRGITRTFTISVSNLAQYGWDNKISTGIIAGNAGGTRPPQGNRVIFYRDMQYSGTSMEFSPGNFSSKNLGGLTANISSIYIPFGWGLQATDRNGRTQTFTSSISSLAQYGWDNRIYSGFIAINNSGGQQGGNNGGNPRTVNLYTEINYRGSITPCGEGRINYLGLGVDNTISSIQLPPGYAITVFDGRDLTGANRTFTATVTNLSVFGWDNKISSVYIFRL